MILKLMNIPLRIPAIRYGFSNAVSADYYKLLDVERCATQEQIQMSYNKIIANLSPENNPTYFQQIHQAFIILSDGKSRDAYDSLAHLRPITLDTLKQPTSLTTKSYIAERKQQKHKKLAKDMNIDKFGRYKGGLPRKNSMNRGKSLGPVGTLFQPQDNYRYHDNSPQHCQIDATRAQSFKDYHQNQRIHRTAKPTWYSVTVCYDYFDPVRHLHTFHWKVIRIIIVILLFPTLMNYYIGLMKRLTKKNQDIAGILKDDQLDFSPFK